MSVVQHSSVSNEHYTPTHVVEAARLTMGSIDLDPASCVEANKIVKAAHYLTKELNGLRYSWRSTFHKPRVFLNPPGGKTRGESNAKLWWQKLANEYSSGNVEQAIFVGFTLEILRSTQLESIGLPIPLDFPLCFVAHRLAFLDEDLIPQKSPTHANVIVYLPPSVDTASAIARFKQMFSGIGKVIVPVRP